MAYVIEKRIGGQFRELSATETTLSIRGYPVDAIGTWRRGDPMLFGSRDEALETLRLLNDPEAGVRTATEAERLKARKGR